MSKFNPVPFSYYSLMQRTVLTFNLVTCLFVHLSDFLPNISAPLTLVVHLISLEVVIS
jgi:hypothetical protein